MNELKRLYMLQICDSLFPIGAFTLSNGLETYVQHGVVDSPETLAAYLADYLALAPYQELGVAALAMQYASEPENWRRLDQLYTACRAPMEVRQGSAKLCMRLIKARRADRTGGEPAGVSRVHCGRHLYRTASDRGRTIRGGA